MRSNPASIVGTWGHRDTLRLASDGTYTYDMTMYWTEWHGHGTYSSTAEPFASTKSDIRLRPGGRLR